MDDRDGPYARPMTASRLAWYGAIATAIVWAFKALAIWEAGGLGKTSLEEVLRVTHIDEDLTAEAAQSAPKRREAA